MVSRLSKLIIIACLSVSAFSQTAPTLFFSDLASGPNVGGESVGGFAGTYVTLYGNNFGASPAVTLNNASCLRVVSAPTAWMWYQKVSVQLGASCTSGNLVVTTVNGSSNGLAFTVRAGGIFCVSLTGNDSNTGKFPSSCWRTIVEGRQISPGDITYVENGVIQTATDGFASLTLNGTGTTANPMAIVVYPGASATIGSITSGDGVRFCNGFSACSSGGSFWVIAGFTLRGGDSAVGASDGTGNWSLIGNDISCPNGDGSTACVTANFGNGFIFLYGNNTHDVGFSGSVKTYHAIYMSSNVNHVWIGWNTVKNVLGCRGIQFFSTGGSDQFDLHVHDNQIHDTRCDGINFSTVNPNIGTVEAYNNLIYSTGKGPDPTDGSSSYSCIRVSAIVNPSTPAKVYNNTMYNCGARKLAGSSGTLDLEIPTNITDNIIFQTAGEAYIYSTSCASLTGSKNDWFGLGAPSCTLTGNLNVDPLLTSVAGSDFHLTASSPAIGTGVAAGSTYDLDGLLRPSPPSIGAYEFASSTPSVAIQRMSGTATVSGSSVMK